MIKKLRMKFIAIIMALMTMMLCVVFGMIYHFTGRSLEAESINMMRSIAAAPFRPGRPGEQSGDLQLPFFTLEIGKRGELLAAGGGYYDLSDEDFLLELIEKTAESHKDMGVLKEHGLRFCRMNRPMGVVLVFADMSSEINTLRNLVKSSAIIGFFSLLVFFVVALFLSRWVVGPVEQAWMQQKQFVADASHELKTPLTVIMTNADMLQSEAYTEEEKDRFSRSILTMSRQMRSLVEKMLELTRSEVSQRKLPMEPVDLSRLTMDAALSFEGVFVEKGLSLDIAVEPNVTVWGNVQALRQVMDILLDNAQKYSVPGGETVLRLYSVGQSKCRLQVSNPGQRLSSEDLKNIFRRFYRMDGARSRDGSFGLGLPIAANIVEQHRGRIWAESREGINSFFVEMHKQNPMR